MLFCFVSCAGVTAETAILMDDPSTANQAELAADRRAAIQKKLTEAENMRTYPLWDGAESVADYAKRINIPPAITVQLRPGVSIEMVLIPAGNFMMGVEEPVKPSASPYQTIESETLTGLGLALFISMLVIPLGRARRLNQRPSFSLRWLMVFTVGLSLISLGAARLIQGDPWEKYKEEMSRYNAVPGDEKPALFECVGHPFYMSKFKLTQAEAGPNLYAFIGDKNPAESNHIGYAKAYCEEFNHHQTDELACIRIPTEAEWEFACRAGSRSDYGTGNLESDLDALAWYVNNSGGTTHPVGQKAPNKFGLYDMLGNLPEWCTSDYGIIVRGGSFASPPYHCRTHSRRPEYGYFYGADKGLVGIRLVMPCWAAKYLEPGTQ